MFADFGSLNVFKFKTKWLQIGCVSFVIFKGRSLLFEFF